MSFEKHSITLEEAKAIKMAANQLIAEAKAEEQKIEAKRPLNRVKLALRQFKSRFNFVIGSKR